MTVLSFLNNAEEPCFCQNEGYFDGNKCVCCGDFTGPYCEEYEGTGEYIIMQSHCMLVQLMIFIAFTQAPFLLSAVASHTA